MMYIMTFRITKFTSFKRVFLSQLQNYNAKRDVASPIPMSLPPFVIFRIVSKNRMLPTCLLFCWWKSSLIPNWICMSQSFCHVLMHADAKSLWRTFFKTFLLLELPGGGLSARSSWSYGHCIGGPSWSCWDARLKINFFNVLPLLLSAHYSKSQIFV